MDSKSLNNNKSSRLSQLTQWLTSLTNYQLDSPIPASADASFRRYFRTHDISTDTSYIVMDAPPDKEDCHPFIKVTQLLRKAQINSPEILAQDLDQGFLLLSDLGNQCYLDHLNGHSANVLYNDAIDSIVRMQTIQSDLTGYDEQKLRDEMDLFESWFVNKHLSSELTTSQKQDLENVFQTLVRNSLEQPQVFVHRDYHSRNLMLVEKNNPGVIDFQDAVKGAITYDLVSLFKDCYIEWPRENVIKWLHLFLDKTSLDIETQTFIRWFDLMGVQRHLKILGIFARLNYRDGKAQYLDDIPLTLKYVLDACDMYDELKPLKNILHSLDNNQ